jgi:hypothetical protein
VVLWRGLGRCGIEGEGGEDDEESDRSVAVEMFGCFTTRPE